MGQRLAIAAAAHFLLILVVYVLLGGNPLSRIHFALFMSVIPIVAPLALKRITQRAVLVYVLAGMCLHLLWGIAHG